MKPIIVKMKSIYGIIAAFAAVCLTALSTTGCFLHSNVYSAADFDIETVKSGMDYNRNDTDDYTDFLLGARRDAENHPTYDARYWDTGYPPDNIGVCSDVVWRAFANAGYCLREMVDRDIHARPDAYPLVPEPDDKIDFRRVRNLKIFFEEYAVSLTVDPYEIQEWQPGDIVIFGADKHIGIISDKRDSRGIAFVIHNGGQKNREENYLTVGQITAHYRFDACLAAAECLVPMESDSVTETNSDAI